MDSGFFIHAWNGFPRAYVNSTLRTIGLKGILKLMHGIEERQCVFKQVLVYYDGHTMKFFESEAPGHIADQIRGQDTDKKWSELWYIFKPLEFEKTLAEFNEDDFKHYKEQSKPSSISMFGEWFKTFEE